MHSTDKVIVMKIKSVEVKNFKSIEELNIELGNLTIISGANSVGKSSFIQTVLLLKQNERIFTHDIDWGREELVNNVTVNGDLVELGNKNNLLFIEANDDSVEIKIHNFESTYGLQYSDNSWKASQFFEGQAPPESMFDVEQFCYLHTNRVAPRMTYPLSDNDINQDSLGCQGQYTAHFLSKNKHRKLAISELKHEDSVTDYMLENVSKWLGDISDNIDVTANSNENTMQATITYSYVYDNTKTKELSPLSIGFGVSYVLPIVTALLKSKPGDLLIIENPEAHLHPKAQANLAKLLALTANNGVQIILETHSDHILNGIRVSCKNGEISEEKLKVYFFNKRDDSLAVEAQEIKISSDGSVSDWPVGFFDEWDSQLSKLLW